MRIANKEKYLSDLVKAMTLQWPQNRIIQIVCHGHSVPAGYFATPMVETFKSYPHLIHKKLKERFPFTVINVIVTATGGEDSESGEKRFESEVLCHKPDLITIDYGLNDRRIGLNRAKKAWDSMISKAIQHGSKVLVLTPTLEIHDTGIITASSVENSTPPDNTLADHANQIHQLATKHTIGLVNSFQVFCSYISHAGELTDLLSQSNHPNHAGHALVAQEIMRWFPVLE